jgi:hypothetical protein
MGLLVIIVEPAAEVRLVGELGLEAINERGKSIERLNTLAIGFVLRGKLFNFTNHALDVILGETTPLVRDGSGLGFTTKTNSQYRSVGFQGFTHVPLSAAATFMIPLASISKVTSI